MKVLPSRIKSYGVFSRLGGEGNKIERIIGNAAAYSPRQARVVAKEWLVQFDQGAAPKATDNGAMPPVKLLEQYLASKRPKPKTERGYRYNFQPYFKPLKSRGIQNLTTDDIVSSYASGKTHATGAERTFVVLKAVMNYALALGYMRENLAFKAALLLKRKVNLSKQQHLSDIYGDLSKIMAAFLKTPIPNAIQDWLVFCLTTGLRKQESTPVKWEQVDLVDKRVTFPANKSDRFLIVPMTVLTYDMFQSRCCAEFRDDIYVSASELAVAIKDARKALSQVRENAGITAYSHRDFRRLFANVCHELDISETKIGKLLKPCAKDSLTCRLPHGPRAVVALISHQEIMQMQRPVY